MIISFCPNCCRQGSWVAAGNCSECETPLQKVEGENYVIEHYTDRITRQRKRMQAILDCDICRQYLAHNMIQPLRCPGLHYDKPSGRKYVGKKGTDSFRWWDEIVKECEEQHEKERLAFLETNRQHLQEHGLFGDLSGA